MVTISACAQSHPASIALRYVQRRILMSDPNWNKGFYYDGPYPRLGMKHARSVRLNLKCNDLITSSIGHSFLTDVIFHLVFPFLFKLFYPAVILVNNYGPNFSKKTKFWRIVLVVVKRGSYHLFVSLHNRRYFFSFFRWAKASAKRVRSARDVRWRRARVWSSLLALRLPSLAWKRRKLTPVMQATL